MNNRLLTPISDDPVDFRPLTPNHVLLFAPESEVPPGVLDVIDNYCRISSLYIALIYSFWVVTELDT